MATEVEVSMRYLFGDSSESALDFNYLAFLRDAIDFAVAALQADAAMAAGRDRRATREETAAAETRAVEVLGESIEAEVASAAEGDAPVNRCAAAIGKAVADAVRREVGQVRNSLASDVAAIEAETRRQRTRVAEALGALLLAHDLPGAEASVLVHWNGAAYEARLGLKSTFGVEAILALDVPSSSIFAHDLRVDRVAEGAEIHAPEPAGWLKKEIKMVPHKLARHHVVEVVVGKPGVSMHLRVTPEAGAAGFDVTVAREGDVTIERRGGDGESSFATDERDVAGLSLLAGKLEDAARELGEHRANLVSATLDGTPLAEHEQPRVLVERVVAAMAPVVNEIASHSLAPTELVLKRLLADDRREEIFVARSELEQKIAPLPPELQVVFAPLGLAGSGGPTGAAGARSRSRSTAPPGRILETSSVLGGGSPAVGDEPAEATEGSRPGVVRPETSRIDPSRLEELRSETSRSETMPPGPPQAEVAGTIGGDTPPPIADPPAKVEPAADAAAAARPRTPSSAPRPRSASSAPPPMTGGDRPARRTGPPPGGRPRLPPLPPGASPSSEATAAAIDRALDDEPTTVAPPPRPPSES